MERYELMIQQSGNWIKKMDDGEYVLHSEAQEEIEKRGKQIDLLNQAIATLITDRDTALSMLEDAEARVLRQNEEISALKSSLNCGDLCAEVTELKDQKLNRHDEVMHWVERCKCLEAKLTRLTAMIEDDDVVKKIARSVPIIRGSWLVREEGIRDYRAMLLEEVKEEKNG
jgi:predicted  nucleic acid-binding Zn-ribbon protein